MVLCQRDEAPQHDDGYEDDEYGGTVQRGGVAKEIDAAICDKDSNNPPP